MRAEWEPDELIGSWALIEAVQTSGDLGVGESVGQPQRDLPAVLLVSPPPGIAIPFMIGDTSAVAFAFSLLQRAWESLLHSFHAIATISSSSPA
jgi:hypothetical protein